MTSQTMTMLISKIKRIVDSYETILFRAKGRHNMSLRERRAYERRHTHAIQLMLDNKYYDIRADLMASAKYISYELSIMIEGRPGTIDDLREIA